MNSQQRISAVLNRQVTDRTPVDIWLVPELVQEIKKNLQVSSELDIYRQWNVDKIVWINPEYYGKLPDLLPGADEINVWGVQLAKQEANAGAVYSEVCHAPLKDLETVKEIEEYPWPSAELFDYSSAGAYARKIHAEFATLGPWSSLFEVYCQMRGLEQAMMDLYLNADFANAALDRLEYIQKERFVRLAKECNGTLDMVFLSDDMGSQQSLLMSPDCFDEFIAPRLTRWCNTIHELGAKVFFHSDGAIFPVIPKLIECGIDVLNPVQHACPGMDCSVLKQQFGDKIIFHGGIENQQILPFGTPTDVRHETRNCLDTLGKNGGYIPCSCHFAQAGTPIENLMAMIDTVLNEKSNI